VRLDDVRAFVFDVDGTLVHRSGEEVHVLPGAIELLTAIRASGRPLALFTNGSHVAPRSFAEGLRDAGLPVADDEMLTPLVSVQVHLRRRRLVSVLLFGTTAAREYLTTSGVAIVDDPSDADAIFVAHADAVDFPSLERAARAILRGAPLLTGSYVPAYAGADGPILSRGAMLTAALAKATGARPAVVGKPSRAAVWTMVDRLGVPAHEIAVIGDDLALDVALGRIGGSRTILVGSGISGLVSVDGIPAGRRPDAVVGDVSDLLDRL
jgi:HAD superfamily hydrolase (TIGR01450 family)